MTEPENSTRQRSKVRPQHNPSGSNRRGMKVQWQIQLKAKFAIVCGALLFPNAANAQTTKRKRELATKKADIAKLEQRLPKLAAIRKCVARLIMHAKKFNLRHCLQIRPPILEPSLAAFFWHDPPALTLTHRKCYLLQT